MDLPRSALEPGYYPEDVRREVLQDVKHEFWRRGNLRYLCLPNAQTRMYDRAHEQIRRFPGIPEPMIYVCHRQLGKSHMGILLVVERAIRQPGAQVSWCMDTVDHAHEIWNDKIGNVTADMPPWISYWTRKNFAYFRAKHWPRNAISTVKLRGVDYKRGDGMRGGNTDMVVIDEVRNIDYLSYVVRMVIQPMWRGAAEPLFLMFTTPPEEVDHDYFTYEERARRSGSLMVIPASENPDWTADDDRMMLAEYGSKQDPGWRRELECEAIPDIARLVTPEWGASDGKYLVRYDVRPAFYRGYVGMDAGWKDHTGMVFALYDFERRRIVCLGEVFVNYTATVELAQLMVEKITALFPKELRRDVLIKAETTALTMADFNRALSELEAPYYVGEAEKGDIWGGINMLRSGISQDRLLVDESCVELDYQLKNARRNERNTDIERSKRMGHADLLVALVYLYRHVLWEENPFPVHETRPTSTQMVNPYVRDDERRETIEAVEDLYKPAWKRGRWAAKEK